MIQYFQNCFEEFGRRNPSLTGSTHKKVFVERFDRETLKGYVNPQTWLTDSGLELLSTAGEAIKVPYDQVKLIEFVRDLDGEGLARERWRFASRPKTEGLWVRFAFKDGDELDGLLANKLLELDPHGFLVTPPDPFSNAQKIFVPRAALADVKVLGVIGGRGRRRRPAPPPKEQIKLFE
jgi:hypothetical protein